MVLLKTYGLSPFCHSRPALTFPRRAASGGQ